MKKGIQILFIIVTIFLVTGCFYHHNQNIKESEKNNMEQITQINVMIDNKKYIAEINANETAQALVDKLPQSFNMSELNGNEKYIYLDYTLPTNSSNPVHIAAGDIMLYGNNCLVIFYKSFTTNYTYTKIGHINNLPDLGDGKVMVIFEK